MMKIIRLKFLRNKYRKKKISFIKKQHFEAAAQERNKEKLTIKQIAGLLLRSQQKLESIADACKPLIFKLIPSQLNGFVVLRKTDSIPSRIDGYMFAVWMNIYIEAALAESETMKKSWKSTEKKTKYRNAFFEKAAEYFFIDSITGWLSTQNGLHEMNRSHIPELLKTNPFLNLFSGEMKYRKVFKDICEVQNVRSHHALDDEGKVLGYYNGFCFKFPFKCKFERSEEAIKFTTPYYDIRFKLSCSGNAQSLPQDYSLLYLGFKRNSGRRIDAHIVATKHFRGLLPWNCKHIKQVHELKEILIEYFSAKYYFDKLDWENKRIMAVVMGNVTSMKASL